MEVPEDRSPPLCKRCKAVMQTLGKLPQLGFRPAVQVFKCVACKVIESKELPINRRV
jgi:hypothetical protein